MAEEIFDINKYRKKPVRKKEPKPPVYVTNAIGEQQILHIDGKLRDVLDTAKKRMDDNWDYCLIICGRVGCQPKGSRVLMADGSWKNIEDVKIGDSVLSPQEDGTHIFSKVINTTNWESEENYDVYQLNRSHKKLYSCSYNHLLPVHYTTSHRIDGGVKRKRVWHIGNFSAKRMNGFSLHKQKDNHLAISSFGIENFEGRKNCLIEPYSLGIFLGDGSFSSSRRGNCKKKKGAHLSIITADSEVMEEVGKYYPFINKYRKINHNCDSYCFSLLGKFSKDLTSLDLEGRGSGEKFIPQEALLSDLEYRKRLLAGLIDSDGYYKNGTYSFTQKSKQLVEDIRNLVYSIGGRCGEIKKVKKTIKSRGFVGTYYRISFYLGSIELPLKVSRRKRKENCFYLSPNRMAIKVVNSKRKERVYGFELDSPSKWYVTDNWMITHNSGKSLFGKMVMKYMQPGATVDNIIFGADNWVQTTVTVPDKSAIMLDETREAMSSGNVLDPEQKKVVAHLDYIRKRKHCLILILPNVFDLPKNVVMFRTSGLIYVYEDPETGKRGCFKYFGYNEKKKLYLRGKKWCDYDAVEPTFRGRFYRNIGIIDEEAYETKKDLFLETQYKDTEEDKQTKTHRDIVIWKLYSQHRWRAKEIAELFGLTEDWTRRIIGKIKRKLKLTPRLPVSLDTIESKGTKESGFAHKQKTAHKQEEF